jgi:hypothetical protein
VIEKDLHRKIFQSKNDLAAAGISLMACQQRFDLRPRRRTAGAADARAFKAGDRRAEPQRLRLVLPLGQRQRETAVQGIAGAERIHRANLEHWDAAHRIALEEDNVVWPVADGEERRGMPGDRRQPFSEIAPAGGCRQALGGKNDMRGDAKQRMCSSR